MTSFSLDTEALVYKYMASICSQKMSNDVVIIIPCSWEINYTGVQKFLVNILLNTDSANFVVISTNTEGLISKLLTVNIYVVN